MHWHEHLQKLPNLLMSNLKQSKENPKTKEILRTSFFFFSASILHNMYCFGKLSMHLNHILREKEKKNKTVGNLCSFSSALNIYLDKVRIQQKWKQLKVTT